MYWWSNPESRGVYRDRLDFGRELSPADVGIEPLAVGGLGSGSQRPDGAGKGGRLGGATDVPLYGRVTSEWDADELAVYPLGTSVKLLSGGRGADCAWSMASSSAMRARRPLASARETFLRQSVLFVHTQSSWDMVSAPHAVWSLHPPCMTRRCCRWVYDRHTSSSCRKKSVLLRSIVKARDPARTSACS